MKKLLSPKAVEEHYDIKCGYLAKLRCSGEATRRARAARREANIPGPTFVKIGRKVYYEPSAIEEFIAAFRRTSTSDAGSNAGSK